MIRFLAGFLLCVCGCVIVFFTSYIIYCPKCKDMVAWILDMKYSMCQYVFDDKIPDKTPTNHGKPKEPYTFSDLI